MAKVWFRTFGVLMLLVGVGVLLTIPASSECHPDPIPPHANLKLTAFAAAAAAVGLGLLYLRQWAVAAFAVVSSLAGAWLIVSPLRGVPCPWTLINLAVGAALLLPAAVAIRHWPLLSREPRRLR